MKQLKYRHTITGQVKTRRQWIKMLDVVARDLPGDKIPTQKPTFKAQTYFRGKLYSPGLNHLLGHA